MKAQFVYENVNFERGKDPKTSMGIGVIGPIVQKAKDQGYYVNENNPDLDKLIQWAGGYGTIKDINILISKGASPDGDMDFVNPLMSAALRRRWDNFYHLIDKGARVENTDQSLLGNILGPYRKSQNLNIPELIKALDTIMQKGYKLSPFDFYRLHNFSLGKKPSIFDHMVDNWYPAEINSDFSMKVMDLDLLFTYDFLKRGFDPNYKNSSPLQLAFKKKNPAVFSTLIKQGAIPRDKLINTILNNPKHHKYLDILKELNLIK
jgi:ankyrin repeat protein